MREAIRDLERLQNIQEACSILLERKETDSLEIIQEDPVKFYGYVKLVEIIGEATYKLTKEFRGEHTEVPWKMMEGMRHILVHDYYRISPIKLWETINNDIPELKPMIDELVKQQQK